MTTLPSNPARYRYQTVEFDQFDIHVRTLRDNQQFNDPDGYAETLGVSPSSWAMFGQLWPSGEALARVMQTFNIANLRILEVGCGLALASLVLNQRKADITATDHHPEAHSHLDWNVRLNHGRPIPYFREGWAEPLKSTGTYDLIIASDVLYEPNHPGLLAGFISTHAEKNAEIILTDPRRSNLSAFSKKMKDLGFDQKQMPEQAPTPDSLGYKGIFRRYTRGKKTVTD